MTFIKAIKLCVQTGEEHVRSISDEVDYNFRMQNSERGEALRTLLDNYDLERSSIESKLLVISALVQNQNVKYIILK